MSRTQVWAGNDKRHIEQDVKKRSTVILGAEEKRSTAYTANALILDESSSTFEPIGKGNNKQKIDGIKEASSTFVANSISTSYLSIISFSSSVELLREMREIGQDKLAIIKSVQQCCANGSTAMTEALELAENQFRNAPAGFIKRAYLLTDGIPNSDPSSIAERLKRQGVQLNIIGFGDGYEIDESLLENMASVSEAGTPLYYHFTDETRLTMFLKKQTRTITQ